MMIIMIISSAHTHCTLLSSSLSQYDVHLFPFVDTLSGDFVHMPTDYHIDSMCRHLVGRTEDSCNHGV